MIRCRANLPGEGEPQMASALLCSTEPKGSSWEQSWEWSGGLDQVGRAKTPVFQISLFSYIFSLVHE